MKKTIVCIICLLALIACSPKLSSVITNKQTPLSPNEQVVVLKEEDGFSNDGIEVGRLRSSDNGFSSHCSYAEVLVKLKEMARQNGANIIKITQHKAPDYLSTCHRIKATIYRVDRPRKFEKEFMWSKHRKLSWEDFKGTPQSGSSTNTAAMTYCSFGFQATSVTLFSKASIVTGNAFDCNLSWVRPDQKERTDLLEHEQGHLDLCEIYTRQLRKRLQEANLTAYHLNSANFIFKQIYDAYRQRQELYEKETNYGLDRSGQIAWNRTIASELLASEMYMEE